MEFIQFIEQCALEKRKNYHYKTAYNYQCAANALRRWICGYNIAPPTLETLSQEAMQQFENYLLYYKGISRNASSAYMRSLRAGYNEAVKRNECTDNHPFSSVYTGIDKTRKRAMNSDCLQTIIAAQLPERLQLTRDLFVFSFLAHGISFIDLAKLRHRNIQGNYIVYQRSKTGQTISILITDTMWSIINKYASKSTRLFPIIHEDFEQRKYDTALLKYNRQLKRISKLCNMQDIITSYTARHSWASEAYRLEVPMSVISTCMGHSSETTTRIYLRSLDSSYIDSRCAIIEQSLSNQLKSQYDSKNT